MHYFKTIFLFYIIAFFNICHAQIVINSSATQEEMVDLLIGENMTLLGGYYLGLDTASGTFYTIDSTNLGIEEGVLLTSGAAINAIGPNTSNAIGLNNQYIGSVHLEEITDTSTYDISVLSLNFQPDYDLITCKLIFGSDEYPEFVSDLTNDAVGFFIIGDNPIGGDYDYYNYALIPETSTPICIHSINNVIPSYPEYYIDNLNGMYIEYDGFTKTIDVYCYVIPQSTYIVRIMIGDAFDHLVDSGVFLEKDSFRSINSTDIAEFSFRMDNNPSLIEDVIGTINNDTVFLVVQEWIDITELVATFLLPPGSMAYVENELQVNSVTTNNFMYPVLYKIQNEIGNYKEWTVIVDKQTGIDDFIKNKIKIYPNPADEYLTIKNAKDSKVKLFDLSSRLIFDIDIKADYQKIGLYDIPNGIYLLQCYNWDQLFNQKIIINHY